MKKTIAALIIALTLCSTGYGMCGWTVMFCEGDGTVCHHKGTAGCVDRACTVEQVPGGKVTTYDDEGFITNTEPYDMTKSMSDNCTETYSRE